MKATLKYSMVVALLLLMKVSSGQVYQFSQFYAAPVYLNPAFTGANVCSRLCLNYRTQWTGIPGTFTTYQASFDHALPKYKSGIGVQFFSDKAGLGGLSTTQVNLLYAYETRISKQFMARAGVSAGTVQRRINNGSFMFGDQIARNDAATSLENINQNASLNYFNLATGILVYSNTMWFGFSADHINKPNQSLLAGGMSPLPPELKFHGGYKIILDKDGASRSLPNDHSITVAFNYKKQEKFNQIDVGAYYAKDLLVIGFWYRGIPLFKPVTGYENNDALVMLFGISIEKCKIGYSYDLTLSKLSNSITRGSHELSMSYQFCKLKKSSRKKLILVSCPKF